MRIGHWYSGWPGAFCLHCGKDDPIELALADSNYDPYSNKWKESTKELYDFSDCKGEPNPKFCPCEKCKINSNNTERGG